MKKFLALLKKELKELMTLQMVLPIIIGVLVFSMIGSLIGDEREKATTINLEIAIINADNTDLSKRVIKELENKGFDITLIKNMTIDESIKFSKDNNLKSLIKIPQGFEKGILDLKTQTIDNYNLVKTFSIFSLSGNNPGNTAINIINEYISNSIIEEYSKIKDISLIKNPIHSNDFTVVKSKIANINIQEIVGFVISQSFLIPVIIFIIIIFSSQMIAVTIASEKENKTLETLLSSPISRSSIVLSKMLASGIMSLVMAGVYMVGMRNYVNGITGDIGQAIQSTKIGEAISDLGLVLDTKAYILIGTSMFLSIIIALALALILGAFAEDVKKAQGMIMPIVLLVMLPYITSLLLDINETSKFLRYFIYAIPFSHTFFATNNIFAQNYIGIVYGIIYQAIVFTVLLYFATKIFKSDKILTMKLKFKKNRGITK